MIRDKDSRFEIGLFVLFILCSAAFVSRQDSTNTKMSQNWCCVIGCTTKVSDGIPLHKFPNPSTDGDRFFTWKTRVGTNFEGLDDLDIFSKKIKVCHRHFEDKYHGSKNRLLRNAIQTLTLPASPQSSSGAGNVPVPMDVDRAAIHLGENEAALQQSSSAACNVPVPMDVDHPAITDDAKEGEILHAAVPRKKATFKATKGDRYVTAEEKSFLKSISRLKMALKKKETERMSFKKRLAAAEKLSLSKAFEILSKKMSKTAKLIFEMQITQAKKQRHGRRFTREQKIMALSIYKPSPKAYRLLSELCILPKSKTLQRLLTQVQLRPGIDETMYEQLKKKVKRIPSSHRYCTLVFDEMAVAASVNFDRTNDLINGLGDDGENRSKKFCDHALVMMVRGVIKKYKQPIVYTFCQGTTPTLQLKKLIKESIKRLQEAGLKVVATVCDQGTTNVAALNALLLDTKEQYIRRNEEYRGDFFEIEGEKVFPLYDPPHLMKGIRNNLLTKDLEYTKNGKKGVAKWEDLQRLYRRAPGYNGLRMVSKLTAQHVEPALIPKMKVKNCTQVFSRTVAVSLGFLANEGVLPKRSEETAELLLFFDDLFDSVNGSSSDAKDGKFLRCAVTPRSPHHALWRASLPTLRSMRYVAKNGNHVSVPSLSSWIKTIEAFQMIIKHFNNLGFRSVLLRNFNQDPLENFFGAIRSHGFSNIMPNASAFESAYKTLLINNMTSAHSVGANCEEDDANSLHNLKVFFEEKGVSSETAEITIFEEDLQIVPTNAEALLKSKVREDIEKCAAVGYCSGWLVKKARKVYKSCQICKAAIESQGNETFHKLIKIKEYKKEKTWLSYPSIHLFKMFLEMENIVQQILDKRCQIKGITNYIIMVISLSVDFSFISCEMHKKKLGHFIVKHSVTFFVHNWCQEINKILQKKDIGEHEGSFMKMAANKYIKNKKGLRYRQTGAALNV